MTAQHETSDLFPISVGPTSDGITYILDRVPNEIMEMTLRVYSPGAGTNTVQFPTALMQAFSDDMMRLALKRISHEIDQIGSNTLLDSPHAFIGETFDQPTTLEESLDSIKSTLKETKEALQRSQELYNGLKLAMSRLSGDSQERRLTQLEDLLINATIDGHTIVRPKKPPPVAAVQSPHPPLENLAFHGVPTLDAAGSASPHTMGVAVGQHSSVGMADGGDGDVDVDVAGQSDGTKP